MAAGRQVVIVFSDVDTREFSCASGQRHPMPILTIVVKPSQSQRKNQTERHENIWMAPIDS